MEIISQYEQAPELTDDGLAETFALSSLRSKLRAAERIRTSILALPQEQRWEPQLLEVEAAIMSLREQLEAPIEKAARPKPAILPRPAALQFVEIQAAKTHDIASHEVEHAYLEEDCRVNDPESVVLPKHELPDDLHTVLLDIIGAERMRVGFIIPQLFGVRRIHPETFASLRLALNQLIEHGKIIQDEKGFFKQRRLAQFSSDEQDISGSQESDLSLTQRIRAAGIGTGPRRRSHSINHRTARTGARRRH